MLEPLLLSLSSIFEGIQKFKINITVISLKWWMSENTYCFGEYQGSFHCHICTWKKKLYEFYLHCGKVCVIGKLFEPIYSEQCMHCSPRQYLFADRFHWETNFLLRWRFGNELDLYREALLTVLLCKKLHLRVCFIQYSCVRIRNIYMLGNVFYFIWRRAFNWYILYSHKPNDALGSTSPLPPS